ncbi:UDP-N-acetylmuramoyl-tripeptide--D-alanyl-D-alanine ligase [Oxalobacteraceae bacterium GrIS 2.11]
MKMSLAQIQRSLTTAGHQHIDPALVIHSVVIDSRKVVPGCLFIAIIGENFDAHDFLEDVIKLGAAAIVVERLPANLAIPAFVVANTRVALGEIAHAWRMHFNLPVIGVTGSNGKTTVKEMIAAILKAAFGADHTLSTQGNLNNDIGVPQTLFRLTAQHQAAVIELGMNHPGEIAQLAQIASPMVGLVNNAQREHQEFMQSVEAVAKENGAVIRGLPKDGVAVFPAGDPYSDLWRSYAGARKVLSFGLNDAADISGTFVPTEFGNELTVSIAGQSVQIQLAAAGVHNVLNALASIAACHAIGCGHAAIVAGLESFTPVSGRLQKKRAHNGAVIIDDTYNANPDSVRAAIHVLAQAEGEKILVLGDMGEVGNDGPAYHVEIGAYAKQQGIPVLLTLGQLARHSSDAFGAGATHFEQIEPLLARLDACATNSSTVLVKGSRFMKMERVVAHLMNTER